MSYRRNNSDEIVGGCILIIGALIIGLFHRLFYTPPEEKLLKLNGNVVWGEELEAVTCTLCQNLCDPLEQTCFNCGASLSMTGKGSKEPIPPAVIAFLFVILIGVVILLIAALDVAY